MGNIRSEKGSATMLVLLTSAIFIILAPVIGLVTIGEARGSRLYAQQAATLYIAEAGIEAAVARLHAEPSYLGTFVGQVGGGSFTVSVSGETSPYSKRIISAVGTWGGGEHRAGAHVTFTQAPLQTFLFQHTLLSGGTLQIRDSVIRGPVRLHALHRRSYGNTFDPGQPVIEAIPDALIPFVNLAHYQAMANAPSSGWHRSDSSDLDMVIRDASALGRQRILLLAGNRVVTLDTPVNFSGIIVIQAAEVRIRRDMNISSTAPLVILTTGDVDIRPGQGHRLDTMGENTLLYSNGTISFTRSEGGGIRQMSGMAISKIGGASPRDMWNANMSFNDAMLSLLQQYAQPDFRQAGTVAVMNVEYVRP